MITEVLVFTLTVLIAYFYYLYYKTYNHFVKNGVKCKPGYPMFGNTLKSTFQRRHILQDLENVYKEFPDERYVGYMEATVPVVMIRDPELIKMITVKDFDHFMDHRKIFTDALFSDSLIMMTGDKWRDMRTTLSPAFTGSKMRLMLPFMNDVSKNIIQHLRGNVGDVVDIDDLIRRYTNDVIATSAFGIEVNSVAEKDNRFFRRAQKMMQFNTVQRIKFFIALLLPKTWTAGMQIFSKDTADFFKNIVQGTMSHREKNKIERPDMIQLLMDAQKRTLKTEINTENDSAGFATAADVTLKPMGDVRSWTLDELTAQAFLFFIAGFESSATALVLTIHELALSTKVQEKLYEEITRYSENNTELNYEGVQKLKYLDCVINETLRKWSPAIILDRVCLKPYTLPPPREGGVPFTLRPGDVVYNVVNAIHMDPQYYPEPHAFDPERFADENKHNIRPFTFIPFGSGPRNCIGSRFALLELKVLIYHLLLNFEILKCEKTTDPITLKASDFNIKSNGGTFVKLRSRN